MIKLISVFSNESFEKYKQARYNKQLLRPRFKNKGTMLLKCKSTPVKVGLRYRPIWNSPSHIVNSPSQNNLTSHITNFLLLLMLHDHFRKMGALRRTMEPKKLGNSLEP